MKTVYSFISERFMNSVLVTQLSEDGIICNKFETVFKNAKPFSLNEYSQRSCEKILNSPVSLQYVDNPWMNPEVKEAMKNYEAAHFIAWNGYVQ